MKKANGFTLAEAVAGILITAIVLIGILKLFSTARALTIINKHKVQAIGVLQARVEQLKGIQYHVLRVSDYPQNENVVIDEGELVSSSDDLIGAMTTRVEAITNGKKIIVTITWTDFYGNITEILETAVYSPS